MHISSAVFDRSAPDLTTCPDESLPEIAFVGRSNVGKSSLLNLLTKNTGLARVSATPGHTKTINIYKMNGTWRLVDLPGYGFAKVARADSARFSDAVAGYLEGRKNLVCTLALLDSSLEPQAIDLEFIQWLGKISIPFALVFTKVDQSASTLVQANIAAFEEQISPWFETLPNRFTCSSVTRHGRNELLEFIGTVLPRPKKTSQGKKAPIRNTPW